MVLNRAVLHFYVLLLEEPRIEVRNLIRRAFLHVGGGGRLLGGERPRERGCELQNLNANFILQDMPQMEEVDVEDPLFIRSLNNKVRKICCNRAIVSPIKSSSLRANNCIIRFRQQTWMCLPYWIDCDFSLFY